MNKEQAIKRTILVIACLALFFAGFHIEYQDNNSYVPGTYYLYVQGDYVYIKVATLEEFMYEVANDNIRDVSSSMYFNNDQLELIRENQLKFLEMMR